MFVSEPLFLVINVIVSSLDQSAVAMSVDVCM